MSSSVPFVELLQCGSSVSRLNSNFLVLHATYGSSTRLLQARVLSHVTCRSHDVFGFAQATCVSSAHLPEVSVISGYASRWHRASATSNEIGIDIALSFGNWALAQRVFAGARFCWNAILLERVFAWACFFAGARCCWTSDADWACQGDEKNVYFFPDSQNIPTGLGTSRDASWSRCSGNLCVAEVRGAVTWEIYMRSKSDVKFI